MRRLTPQSYLILGLLFEGEKHGYEIQKSKLLGIWGIPMSQLYNLLKRLEKEGMISATMAYQEKRPGKKVYTLTDEATVFIVKHFLRRNGVANRKHV